MPFADLQEFVRYLEQKDQLKRVRAEVDPELEVTEITQRVLRDQGPALLFERPKGSQTLLLMNLFGTMDRVRAALGREPAEIGYELITAMEKVNPPSLKGIWESRSLIKRALFTHPKKAASARCQEVIETPDLSRLPILKCWPGDAGRFITYGLVISQDPISKARKCGVYTLPVFSNDMTG